MINTKELAICKRRGHDGVGFSDGWSQCKWCKIWRRRVIEEREGEPPEEEMAVGAQSDRKLQGIMRTIEGKKSSSKVHKKKLSTLKKR